MTYQVLARKWRPQTFEAVVGQDAITRTIRNALAAGRIAHAYLFAGPRGVGKTTTARLLARALLCRERTGPEPCDACAVCEETRAGTAVDVMEIDGASNRGIDEIRALRENVKYAPARGRYKVYIIDEVHQLTEAAFNALLKTLEEPPPHIVFVLATTDPRDIPATVLSRVQRFDFRPIPPETLVKSLERILNEERIAFEPAALPQVVRAAEGSLRDALSLLDTAIAYGNGRVDAETVRTLLGATAPVEVRAFAEALVAYDTEAALNAIDRAAREGEDLLAFGRDAVELLRRVMVLRAAPAAQLADLTSTEANELRALGERVSLDEVLYLVRAFLEADALMRESPHPRVELEIAAVRATRRPVPQALEDVLRRVDEAEQRLRQPGGVPGAAPRAPAQESLLSVSSGDTARGDSRHDAGTPSGGGSPAYAPGGRGPAYGARSGAAPAGGGPGSTVGGSPSAAPSGPYSATPPASSVARSASGGPGTASRVGKGAADAATSPRGAGARAGAPSGVSPSAGGGADAGARSALAPEPSAPPTAIDTSGADAAWQLVVEEVMGRKPMIGGTLMHARPAGITGGVLRVVLAGNHFHRDLLEDRAYRDMVLQAIRRNFPGANDFTIVNEESGSGTVTDHPAVQAVIAAFQGEVVAVRPRAPEGDGQ
jgi:DNA polymerase-3 subunit gamma/tau